MFSIFLYLSFFNVGLLNFSINGLTNVNTDIATNDNSTDSPQNENSKFTPENTTTTSAIKVGEIWDDTNKCFKSAELTQLMKYASNTNVTVSDISAINTLLTNDKRIKASDMRSFNSNKDIIVTMGGLEWTATYLSMDKNNNPILTLWLTDSTQLVGKPGYSNNLAINKNAATTPTLTTLFNYGARTTWSSGFSSSETSGSKYPDAMYGTSYIRSVVLNNGGIYSTSTGGGSEATFSKKTDSVFSPFTVTTKELTGSTTNKTRIADHLVAPVNVSWQEHQSFREAPNNSSWNLPNEGWETGQVSSTYYTSSVGNYNYSNKTHYSDWKYDLIWLPSLSETGYSANRPGIWDSSINQRSDPDNDPWLRSGDYSSAEGVYVLKKLGAYCDIGYPETVSGFRPSLHLNLNSAAESAMFVSKDLWIYGGMNARNTRTLLKYLSGSTTDQTANSYLASLTTQMGVGNFGISDVLDSRQIYINANKNTDKSWLNTTTNELIVELGGLKWYAVYLSKEFPTSENLILTLYLADSGQLNNLNYINSSGAVTKFNLYGSASWNSGESPYRSPTEEYPIYSTSFMRENVLNNKYDLVNSNYSTQSVFALFTTSTYSQSTIADFLYTPSQVQWQNGQSAKNTLAFRYNLLNEAPNNLNNFSNTYSFLKTTALNTTTYNELSNASVLNRDSSFVSLTQNDKMSDSAMLSDATSNNIMLTNSTCHAERSEASYNNVILSASEESIPITLNAPIMYSAVGTADTQTTLALTILETYDIWKYDRLWLPSLTETGGGDKVGLWKLSNAQRKNTNGTASWLRSGHMTISNSAYTLTADGTNYGYATINTQNGIRPALHLNLTLASALAV